MHCQNLIRMTSHDIFNVGKSYNVEEQLVVVLVIQKLSVKLLVLVRDILLPSHLCLCAKSFCISTFTQKVKTETSEMYLTVVRPQTLFIRFHIL